MVEFNAIGTGISAAVSSVASTVVSGVSSMIGRNWLSVGVCGGFGFGLVQGAVSAVAQANMPKQCPKSVQPYVADVIGGAAVCGLSYAAAAVGIVAAPISIPTAAVLTVAVVAFKYFFAEKFLMCALTGVALALTAKEQLAGKWAARKANQAEKAEARKLAEDAQVKQQEMAGKKAAPAAN